MGQRTTWRAIVLILACAMPSLARAGIIWNSGSLHAEAHATNPGGTMSSTPADVIMITHTASHSASATAPTTASASGSTNCTIGPASLTINASTDFGFGPSSSASASVSGTSTFTEDATEHLTPSFTASANRGSGGVTIKDSANNVVASFLSSSPPVGQPPQVVLAPGVYTVVWNWATQPFVGTGGGSGMNFQLANVPEPTTLTLLAIPAMLLIRRGRRVHVA
jgi:hypothetical protein